jgi:hypothetical protein
MAPIPERWLQDQVRQLCADLGLHVQHVERSDLAKCWLPGWPDLVILGRGWPEGRPAILYRELKGSQGNMSRDQNHVGRVIMEAGGDFAVWRPSDLTSGRITRELTAISRMAAGNADRDK